MNLSKLHEALLLIETMIDFGDAPIGLVAVRDILESLYIGADNCIEPDMIPTENRGTTDAF